MKLFALALSTLVLALSDPAQRNSNKKFRASGI
jgi:hypothetical protein